MSTTIYIAIGLVVLVVLSFIGILSRYRKCRSDEVLVVYGKTSGNTSSKCYHGGSAFVWPVFQGYAVMSMKPMQLVCNLEGALSAQKIKVNVPTIVTVAISEDKDIMQNAAVRLLGLSDQEKEDQIKDVIWGQMRLVIAEMEVEQLISDRDNFLTSCRNNIETELKKFGLALININIADVTDEAHYIENLGKEAATKASAEAQAAITKREKEGAISISEQTKEREVRLSEIEKDKKIQVSENEKIQAIRTTEIDKEKSTITQNTQKEKDVQLRDIERERNVQLSEKAKDEAIAIREVQKQQTIETANLEKEEATKASEIEKEREVQIATFKSEQQQKVAEQERLRDSEVAKQKAEAATLVASANAKKDAEITARQAESEAAQIEARQESAARQVAAQESAEAKKERAKKEKEANIATYESEARQKKADADKTAKLAENAAGVEVAKSEAVLGKATADSSKMIGEAKAESEMAVGIAQAKKEEEIARAKRKAEEERLKSTIMVETEIEADRKKAEAEGYRSKVMIEAEANAEAIRLKADAEAEAIRVKKLAEAEGELKMAEVKKASIAAETAHLVELSNAGTDSQAIISWILRDQYKEIAAEQAKIFEHIQTGNVTVVGDASTAGNFMKNIAEMAASTTPLLEKIPGGKGLLGKLDKFDKKHAIEEGKEDEVEFPDPETSDKREKRRK